MKNPLAFRGALAAKNLSPRCWRLIGFLAACGGGTHFGTDAIDPHQAENVCHRDCTTQASCGGDISIDACTRACEDDVLGWARADAVESVLHCRDDLPCGSADDDCVLAVQPLGAHVGWETECRSALATCFAIPSDLDHHCAVAPDPGDLNVGLFRFVAPAIMTDLIACLGDADCPTRLACIDDIVATRNIRPFY